ncbi:MAG TPA: 2OG-Fe(II) oxygenase [Cellvibrionaceae bacterium]
MEHTLIDILPLIVEPDEQQFDQLADTLVANGYVCLPDYFPSSVVSGLRALFNAPDCEFKTAGIGRADDFTVATDIRGDKICWLEGASSASAAFLSAMGDLRLALNRRLFLGLFDYESHLAYYPPGSFYKKHYDAFRGRSNRVLSTVAYLNPEWQQGWGGELVIYQDDGITELIRIEPRAGTLVVFLSERFAHEVLPAIGPRYSVAGWFRVNANTASVVDPPA